MLKRVFDEITKNFILSWSEYNSNPFTIQSNHLLSKPAYSFCLSRRIQRSPKAIYGVFFHLVHGPPLAQQQSIENYHKTSFSSLYLYLTYLVIIVLLANQGSCTRCCVSLPLRYVHANCQPQPCSLVSIFFPSSYGGAL